MASHRPYRPSRGIEKALEEISRNRGVLYDATVVDACLRVIENGSIEALCESGMASSVN
jgi:HD-GYP domain-containing protein (c-di-GMP phosphodiesterase class II)